MNKYKLLIALTLLSFSINAQFWRKEVTIRVNDPPAYEIIEGYEYPSREIHDSISKIVLEEKMALKNKIKDIDRLLELDQITSIEAENRKKVAAEKHAASIETRVAIEESKMQQHLQDFTNEQIATITVDSIEVVIKYGSGKYKGQERSFKRTRASYERSKKSGFRDRPGINYEQGVVAFGLNNVIVDNKISSISESDYYIWKSRFYEVGYTFKWGLFEKKRPFFFKIGGSLLFNNLKATDNRYHVKSGEETYLEPHPNNLKVARLKNIQLIFPLHLEVDFTKPDKWNDIERQRTERTFRFGIGGYGGVRLYSRQIVKYKENGLNVKEKTNDHYNLNSFTYGLSSYFGYRSTSLYAKYDLNTLFKNSNTNGVSLGIRIEI